MSKYNNVKGGVVSETLRNYQGGFSKSLRSLTEGGRGGQKSEKLPYVIYERPLSCNVL